MGNRRSKRRSGERWRTMGIKRRRVEKREKEKVGGRDKRHHSHLLIVSLLMSQILLYFKGNKHIVSPTSWTMTGLSYKL